MLERPRTGRGCARGLLPICKVRFILASMLISRLGRVRYSRVDIMGGGLDLLFLNSGIQPASSWGDQAAFKTIMYVNFGVVHGISHFIDVVTKNPGSVI